MISPLTRIRNEQRYTDQYHADGHRTDGIEYRLAVTVARPTNPIASTRPTRAAMSSPSTTTSSALRVPASHLPKDLPPRTLLISAGSPAASEFEQYRDSQHQQCDPRPVQLFCGMQLVPAFVDRKQSAHAEQHQRDDEAPEIGSLAVAQGVFLVRRTLGLAQSHVQQHLVAAVGEGVDGLRHHAARIGEYCRGQLGHCYPRNSR